MAMWRFHLSDAGLLGALAIAVTAGGVDRATAAGLYASEKPLLQSMVDQLVSSLGIKVRQIGTGASQSQTTALRAAEAQAGAVVSSMGRLASVQSVNDSVLGRDQVASACSVSDWRVMAGQSRSRNKALEATAGGLQGKWIKDGRQAGDTLKGVTRQRWAYYCTREEFAAGLCEPLAGIAYNLGAPAGDSNAGVFMDGGARGVEEASTALDYVDRVAPFPSMIDAQDIETAVLRRRALSEAASVSMAREILTGSALEGLE